MSTKTNLDGTPCYRPCLMKKKKEVCPICWRSNCRLFIRMGNLKFTDEDRREFFKMFHRDVCSQCKRMSCSGVGCVLHKVFPTKKKTLPAWWGE